MNLDLLRTELVGDPLERAYDLMTDAAAAASLNNPTRTRNRQSMTGSEVLNAVDAAEWAALTDAQRQVVWDVLHLVTLNPSGVEATLLSNIFGLESATIAALADARQETVSRATELGLGVVRSGTVAAARA